MNFNSVHGRRLAEVTLPELVKQVTKLNLTLNTINANMDDILKYFTQATNNLVNQVNVELRNDMVCGECGEYKPDDARVEGGMKCGECAYGS